MGGGCQYEYKFDCRQDSDLLNSLPIGGNEFATCEALANAIGSVAERSEAGKRKEQLRYPQPDQALKDQQGSMDLLVTQSNKLGERPMTGSAHGAEPSK